MYSLLSSSKIISFMKKNEKIKRLSKELIEWYDSYINTDDITKRLMLDNELLRRIERLKFEEII